jgi:hypothetical protein
LTQGTGISVTNGSGSITLANTGVTALTTSSGLSTNTSATGAVSVTNTGVTSVVAGTGISVSGATGAVTISSTGGGTVTSVSGTNGLTGTVTTSGSLSLDYYTGSTVGNTSYPIGSYLSCVQNSGNPNVNATTNLLTPTNASPQFPYFGGTSPGAGSVAISGTWRSRGSDISTNQTLFQRTA